MLIEPKDWLTEDGLMLLESWSRDGYTFGDIANRIGISKEVLRRWRKKYPEIERALKNGREIVDYKVENALLKAALGYKTREVKVTTTMRHGKVIETIKETTDKEQSPNVSAIQCWLFNRLPDKWKKNRDSIIDLDDKDTTIQVTVTRASDNETGSQRPSESLESGVNRSVTIRSKTDEELEQDRLARAAKTDDLDFWPDDWCDV